MKKYGVAVLGFLILGFLGMQFSAFTHEFDNPPISNEPEWPDAYTAGLARRACYDCHSNETHWPWYAYTWPMGSTIEYDVETGREVLNFSEWPSDCCSDKLVEQMAIVVNNGEMPLPYYEALHPEAQLTFAERGRLTNGLLKMMTQSGDALDKEDQE